MTGQCPRQLGPREGTELSGSPEVSAELSLDVVKARIFYLASDVEPVSPPAAMLLRAVADAIAAGNLDAPADAPATASERPAPLFAETSSVHPLVRRAPDPELDPARRQGIAATLSSQKR